MAEDDEDLYDDDFDFVDDDDEIEDEVDEAPATEPAVEEPSYDQGDAPVEDAEAAEEYERPAPAANYVVHIYEFQKFKRTIDRPFTPEDAEAFASEYNRTSKPYGRFAVTGKNDAHPRKTLE